MSHSVLLSGALMIALGSCGSSEGTEAANSDDTGTLDSSGESTGDFCELIRAEIEPTQGSEESFADLAENTRGLIDAAPEELRDDLELVADTYDGLAMLDESDEEAYAAFEESNRVLFDEANENLAMYAVDECGIEI